MKRRAPIDKRYVIKPVVGAFAVLDALVRNGGPMSLADFAKSTRVSKTTVFRYLKTLDLLGYVARTSEGWFEIGPSSFLFGKSVGVERALRALADAEMKALSTTFGETVNLAIPNGKRLNYVAILDPTRLLHFSAEVGDSECFHSTALGKALLAFMPAQEVDQYLSAELRRFTPRTITKRNHLQRELGRIRRLGYAIDREENELGCVCYAAPILGEQNLPIAALSVSIPTPHLSDRLDLAAAEAVKEAAARVTHKICRDHEISKLLSVFRSARGRLTVT